jgi:hypothetical protein
MRPSNKPRVFLALYHRGKKSLPSNSDDYGLASFHWALLFTPKGRPEATHMLDVTDAMQVDPVLHVDTNPDRNWVFRDKVENPLSHVRLVLIAMVGKLRSQPGDLQEVISVVQKECLVPKKEAEGENCVWWVREALLFLQARKLIEGFDVDSTFRDAQLKATDRIVKKDIAAQRAEVISYTRSVCDVRFASGQTT